MTIFRTARSFTCVVCSTAFSTNRNYHEHCYNVHKSITSRAWLENQGHDLPKDQPKVTNATSQNKKSLPSPIVISKDSYRMQSEDGSSFVITPLEGLEESTQPPKNASSQTPPQSGATSSGQASSSSASRTPPFIAFLKKTSTSLATTRLGPTPTTKQPTDTRVSATTWPIPESIGTTTSATIRTELPAERMLTKAITEFNNYDLIDLTDDSDITDVVRKMSPTSSKSATEASETIVSTTTTTPRTTSPVAFEAGRTIPAPTGRNRSKPGEATPVKTIDLVDLTDDSEKYDPSETFSTVSRTTPAVQASCEPHYVDNPTKQR